jgi:FkbM family methyltransferase
VQLWQEGREVRTSDDLLHELAGRPITDEIRVLYIIGAHLFQEQKLLFALFPNLQKVYLFEPIPSVVQRLRVMTADDPRVRVFGYAIADVNGPVDFHLTDNNGESSSLLHLGTHKQIFPWVHEAATITVEAHVLDAVVAFHQLPPPDMLFLDVQGAEYRILNTLSHTLREGLRLIYTECSTEEIYRGARVLEDVQALLSPQFGFAGFAPLMKQSPTHGNALFVKMEDAPLLVKKEAQTVAPTPQQGRPVPQQPLSGTSLLHEAVVFSREFIRLFEAADYEGAVEHYRSNRPRFKDTDPTIVQLDEIMLKVAANSSAEEH